MKYSDIHIGDIVKYGDGEGAATFVVVSCTPKDGLIWNMLIGLMLVDGQYKGMNISDINEWLAHGDHQAIRLTKIE